MRFLASVGVSGGVVESVIPHSGLIQFGLTLALALFATLYTAKLCTDRWQGSKTKVSVIGGILAVLAITASMLFNGLGMHNVQTIFLSCVFLYISYGDIKTHEADNWLHFLVLAVALITKPANEIPVAIISAAGVFALMLLVAVLVKGAGIGGADIKFCTAAAFLTKDFMSCLFALGIGTFVALLCNSPFRKKEKAGEGFPMLPYLSCSYMLIFLLS